MGINTKSTARYFLAVIAILGLFAIPAQLYLAIENRQAGIGETIVRFFSYFTILTNLLILVSSVMLVAGGTGKWTMFFERASTRTAIAVYISVVGVIYNTILASQWNPQGLQLLVDQVLHTIIPILYVIYWLIYVRSYRLEWRQVLPWTIYPLLYCVYTLLRGPIAGFYPYPFMNVDQLGYTQVFINVAGVIVAFIFISAIFVAATRIIRPTKSR